MARELVPYEEIEKIHDRLETEDLQGYFWREFSKLNNSELVEGYKNCRDRSDILDQQNERLETLSKKFGSVCSYFSPRYARLREMAIHKIDQRVRNMAEQIMVWRVGKSRNLDVMEEYFSNKPKSNQ